MRIGWVSGWAVPLGWFRSLVTVALPDAEHVIVAPTPGAIDRLRVRGPFDWIVGYSLGTHLLLMGTDEALLPERVALLAPIWTFPVEAEQGGKVSRTQLRYLRRWLRRDPSGAIVDFYRRAELELTVEIPSGSQLDDLAWGLDRLESGKLTPMLPEGWKAWCGAADALLDARRLQAIVPAVRVVAEATHHPESLLKAFSKEVA